MNGGKPDLFEVGCLELIEEYQKFMHEVGFYWPTISAASDHVIAAMKLFQSIERPYKEH